MQQTMKRMMEAIRAPCMDITHLAPVSVARTRHQVSKPAHEVMGSVKQGDRSLQGKEPHGIVGTSTSPNGVSFYPKCSIFQVLIV